MTPAQSNPTPLIDPDSTHKRRKDGLPDGALITEDGMVISLPANSKEITVD
jgi:hypothetical protein